MARKLRHSEPTVSESEVIEHDPELVRHSELISEINPKVALASIAKFDDQVEELKAAGVAEVFNLYAEAGSGFAEHVLERQKTSLSL